MSSQSEWVKSGCPQYYLVELFLTELFCWRRRKLVFSFAIFSTVDSLESFLSLITHIHKEICSDSLQLFSSFLIPFLSHEESSAIKEAPDVVRHLSPFTISWHGCESGPKSVHLAEGLPPVLLSVHYTWRDGLEFHGMQSSLRSPVWVNKEMRPTAEPRL